MRISSTSAAKTPPQRSPSSELASQRQSDEWMPSKTWTDVHHVPYAPTVMNAPCAKLRTPIRP
jgi:hypothetical protein